MARLAYILMTMFEMKASHLFCFDVPFEENCKREMTKRYSEDVILRLFGDTSNLSPIYKNRHIEIVTEDSYDYRDAESEEIIDAVDRRVKHIISYPSDCMTFTYDFGDNWQVSVVLEKIIVDKVLPGKELPRVLEGEGFGIIEDCCGVGGLEDILKAFKKKKGVKYQEYCDWIGVSDLDLLSFDIDDINYRLKKVPRIYADVYEHELKPTKQSLDLLDRKYLRP